MAIERGIRVIAYLKLLKCALFILSGIGLLNLQHEDAADMILRWVNALSVDPSNRHVQNLIIKASFIDGSALKVLSLGSFAFAGISLTEGVALLLQKPWAKTFTVVVMSLFIPFELWKLMEQFSGIKVLVISANLMIVGYMVSSLRTQK